MKKKVMEYIDNFIGNSIYDILKFIFFLLIPSGMITTFVESAISKVVKNTFVVVLVTCLVLISSVIVVLIIYKNIRKYKFEYIYQYVTFEYSLERMVVTTEYKVKAKRNNLKSMYSRSSWFKDEKQKIKCLNKNYKINYLENRDTSTEFEVVFDSPMKKNEVRTITVRVEVTNKHRHFENFYSREIISPVNELKITLVIPSKYKVKSILKEEIYGSFRDERSISKKVDFNIVFVWTIRKCKMRYYYKISW